MLGEQLWRRLHRAFFHEARCHTPYFRDIPRELLDWLPAESGPRWLKELAHYEWIKLALDVMDAETPAHDPRGDLMAGIPVLAPALMNLAYAWPVQRIGPDYRPRKPRQTSLLVYRDTGDDAPVPVGDKLRLYFRPVTSTPCTSGMSPSASAASPRWTSTAKRFITSRRSACSSTN